MESSQPLPTRKDWAASPTATSSHSSAQHCGLSQDLTWQLYASDRKLSTHVDVSLLEETSLGVSQDRLSSITQECAQVRLQARLLRSDNRLLKAQLKTQRCQVQALQVDYQDQMAALHRDICHLRGMLKRSPGRLN
jgi:hypothetical protein